MFESPSAEASLIDRVVISGFRYSRNSTLILKPEISDRQSFRALARANDSLLIDAIQYVIPYLLGQYLSGLQTRNNVSVIASHTHS